MGPLLCENGGFGQICKFVLRAQIGAKMARWKMKDGSSNEPNRAFLLIELVMISGFRIFGERFGAFGPCSKFRRCTRKKKKKKKKTKN
jgi:hypothetical protein